MGLISLCLILKSLKKLKFRNSLFKKLVVAIMVDVQVVMQVKGHSFKIDIVESPVKRLKGDFYLHTQAGLEAAHRSLLAPQEEGEMPDPGRPERGPGCTV